MRPETARRPRLQKLIRPALLCLLIAPVTWWRAPSTPDERPILSMEQLPTEQPEEWPSSLRLLGTWRLRSSNSGFGGYSALLALSGGRRLVAYSDSGGTLAFSPPGEEPRPATFDAVPELAEFSSGRDVESVAYDRATGTRWLGIESINAVYRLSPAAERSWAAYPPQMNRWPGNSGAEAMLRLPDGRFILLAERKSRFSEVAGPGLLFASDPAEYPPATPFRFEPPEGFLPTDMAQLPDGRVLILLRALDVSIPPFRSLLVVADSAEIRAEEPWPWKLLAPLSPPLPRENYEGLAVVALEKGGADIWIISDDNQAPLQRTLLHRLRWQPAGRMKKGAPESSDAP